MTPFMTFLHASALGKRCALLAYLVGVCLSSSVVVATEVEVVSVEPQRIALRGAHESHGLLVHGRTPRGNDVDLTFDAAYSSLTPNVVRVDELGVVRGTSTGTGQVAVELHGKRFVVDVTVEEFETPRQFHFEHDILPILTRFGCNGSGCHGKAEGQNGFKLSVFGFNVEADYEALAHEARGRRVSVAAPQRSLLLLKAAGGMPHGGGERFDAASWPYEVLRGWIEAGLPRGAADAPSSTRIEVLPRQRRLEMGSTQQLRVIAHLSNGRSIDVTSSARYQSNNDGVASVNEHGLVSVAQVPGQAAIMANYMGHVGLFEPLIPRSEPLDAHADLAAANFVDNNFIDGFVHAKLKKLNIVPSGLCADSDFLRRAHIDIIGTLPTPEETRSFLADARPDRRALLVDRLLERPEYAAYWALKWSDLLRVDRAVLGYRGAYAYYRWIRASFAQNKPMDRFVSEILTAEGPEESAPQGGLFRVVKEPGARASTVSQVFLGVRIECAQCHHHPSDRWSQNDYYGMSDFFAALQTKKTPDGGEALLADGSAETFHPRTGKVVYAHALGTREPERPVSGDRRLVLAEWLTSADNEWFARNLANRVWAHFMGRGIVDPVDDVRATNPPSNRELLDSLAAQLTASGFDLKALIRAITASRTYQRSTSPNATNRRDSQNYSRALLKPLEAEVLLDAISHATGIDEKFAGTPAGQRAIELWDSGVKHYFLGLFGRPVRKTACECERANEPSVAQVLHLLNSPQIHAKLAHQGGRVAQLAREVDDDEQLLREIYLTFVSRHPNARERDAALRYLRDARADRSGGRVDGAIDIAWSLLNSLEFTMNH